MGRGKLSPELREHRTDLVIRMMLIAEEHGWDHKQTSKQTSASRDCISNWTRGINLPYGTNETRLEVFLAKWETSLPDPHKVATVRAKLKPGSTPKAGPAPVLNGKPDMPPGTRVVLNSRGEFQLLWD